MHAYFQTGRTCADPGIFVRGGPGQSDKKALTFFFFFLVLSSFYRSQVVNFKEIYHFFKVPEGVQHFPGGGGSNFFQRGFNCLFPMETHITCDFPGGSGPPVPPPPSGSVLVAVNSPAATYQ